MGQLSGHPLCVLAGPTGSGKSALALRVARAHGAEIVSADSQQVYRGFDIGTAKPSEEELALVPHHLVSCVEPSEPFSAGHFQAAADAAIAAIQARGKPVLVVGGTGLYLRFLLRGALPELPASPELRAGLEAEAAREGWEALHRRLETLDPDAARDIAPRDHVRILRALEIHSLTGKRPSELRRAHGFGETRYPHTLWVLDPPRDELYALIDRRTRAMFEGGLLEEVAAHLDAGRREDAPMKSVGYVQACAVVEGRMTLEQAIEEAARATRRYAKRQRTWFKKEPAARFVWPLEEAERLVSEAVRTARR